MGDGLIQEQHTYYTVPNECAHSASTVSERHAYTHALTQTHNVIHNALHYAYIHEWKKFPAHVQLHAAWTEVTTTVHCAYVHLLCSI